MPNLIPCYSILFILLTVTLYRAPAAQPLPRGQFSSLTTLATNTTTSTIAHTLTATANGTLYLAGTATPPTTTTESDFGVALDASLRQDDIFFVKLSPPFRTFTSSTLAFRLGTPQADHLHAMLVHENGASTFLAGRTVGTWRNATQPPRGQDDLFVVKLHTFSSPPSYAWKHPLTLGTTASEAVTALAADPHNDDVIYATGYTSGSLFGPAVVANSVLRDAIIFAFSATNGSILFRRQFGTAYTDSGTGIVVSTDKSGPIFVSVVTEPKYGQYSLGNFHLYKFSRNLQPLGDVLLSSYSRETVTAFTGHAMLDGTLLVGGYSWLDEMNGYDIFLKRVVRRFDNEDIGSSSIAIDEVGQDEYTFRFGSEGKANDFLTAMVVHPASGRLLAGGYTSGTFSDSVANGGEHTSFIICMDPITGSITDLSQVELSDARSRVELAALSLQQGGNSVYYASNVMDARNSFSISVGIYGIPESCKTRIPIPKTPSPSPSSRPMNAQNVTVAENSGFSIMSVVPGIAGGVVALLIVVVCCIVIRRRRMNGDGTKNVQLKEKEVRAREKTGKRTERIINVEDSFHGERTASELV